MNYAPALAPVRHFHHSTVRQTFRQPQNLLFRRLSRPVVAILRRTVAHVRPPLAILYIGVDQRVHVHGVIAAML